MLEKSSYYTSVPKTTIIWGTLPEIQSETDKILSFWAIFCLLTLILTSKIKIWNKCNTWRYYPITHGYHKWRSYDVWFLKYKAQQTVLFVILGHFLPFDPPNNLKNQSFEKMKLTPEDILILHLDTTNDDHMMYDSWDMERDRQNFLLFWIILCPFTP